MRKFILFNKAIEISDNLCKLYEKVSFENLDQDSINNFAISYDLTEDMNKELLEFQVTECISQLILANIGIEAEECYKYLQNQGMI